MLQRYAYLVSLLFLQFVSSNAWAACLNASPGENQWQNRAFSQAETGTFIAQATVNAPQAGGDVILSVTQGPRFFWTGLATSVRFHTNNMIDVVNGNTYSADIAMPFEPHKPYRIRMVINIPAHTYSVYVAPYNQAEQLLARDYAFRAGHENVTSLDNWNLEAEIGNGRACEFVVDYRSWSGVPQNITTTARNHRVAMGGNGTTITVWEQQGPSGVNEIWGAIYTPGSGWGAPQRLGFIDPSDAFSSPPQGPDVAMDDAGNGMVVWSEPYPGKVWVRRYTNGSWGAPEKINDNAFSTGIVRLAMNARGEAVATWMHDGGAPRVSANHYVPGRGWTGTQELLSGGDASSPEVAIDGSGRATTVYFKIGPNAVLSASHLE